MKTPFPLGLNPWFPLQVDFRYLSGYRWLYRHEAKPPVNCVHALRRETRLRAAPPQDASPAWDSPLFKPRGVAAIADSDGQGALPPWALLCSPHCAVAVPWEWQARPGGNKTYLSLHPCAVCTASAREIMDRSFLLTSSAAFHTREGGRWGGQAKISKLLAAESSRLASFSPTPASLCMWLNVTCAPEPGGSCRRCGSEQLPAEPACMHCTKFKVDYGPGNCTALRHEISLCM